MKSPNPKLWESLPSGLRYLNPNLHPDSDVIIELIEERKPLSASRVYLYWQNRDTKAKCYWNSKHTAYLKPQELSLRYAMERAHIHYRSTTLLLAIGITDEHEYRMGGFPRW